MWKRLALTMSQDAALTGASERQIQHWMDQGYIAPATRGTRKINGETLDMIVLIKEARQQGVPLRQAVVVAREYLASETSSTWESGLAPTLLQEVQDALLSMRLGVESVEEMIQRAQHDDVQTHIR